jgi:KUP system potassium uptake protein
VNWLLFAGVLLLVAVFGSSQRLATAYGLAVTGTLLLTTALFVVHAATAWRWARWKLALVAVVIGGLELTYLGANLTKIVSGGWLPLTTAAIVITVMTTWHRGRRIITARRTELEGSLREFVEGLPAGITRVPGTAVFPHATKHTAPLALRANLAFNHVLHEQVVIVSVQVEDVPHVPDRDRFTVDDLGGDDGVVHLRVRFGFQDEQDIPTALRRTRGRTAALECDADSATYYLSRVVVVRGRTPGMSTWRKRLFVGLSHNAANPAADFHLPVERTVLMGSRIEL